MGIEDIIIGGCDSFFFPLAVYQLRLLLATIAYNNFSRFSFSFYIAKSLKVSTAGIVSASHLGISVHEFPSDLGWLLQI